MSNALIPSLIVIMGVSGTGKSSLAECLSNRLHYRFIDADDFHSDEAKAMMANAKPITSPIRQAWINRLSTYLSELAVKGQSVVLAYSGLIASHRKQIAALPFKHYPFLLIGDENTIFNRMKNRTSHFANPKLLTSQINSFEPITEEESNLVLLNLEQSLEQLTDEVISIVVAEESKQ
ncbi:AAA family ATPase [Thalassotalea sp. M1531]|uniref:gluconokinase n=1 Tax=Thalassotalea algicola TaxID=2716224 RepID=A0A7Y0Q754_9GAMM|nr:shikimate kinase [Thalassotalea algicola]NMP31517.1 AAA family ATPase [Thalassotalea algicola]